MAELTHEVIGTTDFGDPKVVVTVAGPHPKEGFQLLLTSTESMDHMAATKADTGKVTWLVDSYPPPERGRADWHGSARAATLEDALAQVAEHVDWLTRRDEVCDRVETGGLSEHLDRFQRGLYETSAIDYEEEWQLILAEVARIDLIMRGQVKP